MGDAHIALSKTMRHHQWWKGACTFESRMRQRRIMKSLKSFICRCDRYNNGETIGDSYVFHLLVEPEQSMPHVSGSPWWLMQVLAGIIPRTAVFDWKGDGPSVVLSLQDALTYCDWARSWNCQQKRNENTQHVAGFNHAVSARNDLEEDGKFHANRGFPNARIQQMV